MVYFVGGALFIDLGAVSLSPFEIIDQRTDQYALSMETLQGIAVCRNLLLNTRGFDFLSPVGRWGCCLLQNSLRGHFHA